MKKLIILFCFVVAVAIVHAQQRSTVTGKVTQTSDNSPIPGVSVVVKGTTLGTITDFDGNYNIEAPSSGTLVFSFVGLNSQEIPVAGKSVINASLSESTEFVDEVVVVGYGQMKVKDLTSSISTLKSDELVKTPGGQAMQALQGKVAGVQIVSAGAPGGSPTVRIRGLGSYPGSSDSNPLYVVDGAFFDNIDFLNPADIESLSVLKDASAAAIYGVRAANGVVLITTKQGALNRKTSITYDGYVGVQVPQNVLKMANAEQFVNYINQTGSTADISFIENAMQRYGRSRVNPNIPDVNTDWYAEMMKSHALQQNHNLSITGGNDKTNYSIGVSYFAQDGLMETKNSYKRASLHSKLDHQATNWLKVGTNFNLSNGVKYIGDDAAWFSAYHAVPILPVYDEENYAELVAADVDYPSHYSSARLLGYRGGQNPFLNLAYRNNREDLRVVQSNVYGEFELLPKKLTFKSAYNVAMHFTRARNVGLPYWVTNDTKSEHSSITSERKTQINQYFDNTLTYTNSFGKHNLSAMVGTSFRDEWYDYLKGYAEDIPLNENAWYIGQSATESSKTVDDDASRYYGISYFGRVSYNYDNRYIAYATLRRDGSSKYQEKWGTFPAFGLGWVVSEEDFFKNVKFINYLKIRGGWGVLGNDKVTPEDGANTTSPIYLAIDDIQTDGTTTTSTFGYLRWEKVEGTNIGITAELLRNRLTIETDYYVRDTKSAVIPIKLLLQSGEIKRNAGVIRNSGFELAMTWSDKINQDWQYSISTNIATVKNQARDLYGQAYINGGSAEFRQRTEVGEPLASFYGYEVAGVYQNQAEIDADPIAVANGLVPGDLRFKDQDNSETIDDKDKVFLGSYIPTFNYGGNLGLTYKNLEFSLAFMGQTGNKILNRKRGEIIWTNDTNVDADLATGVWNGEGTSNKYPSASGLRRGWNQNFSNYLVEDGAFFRIQNVQLAYNIKGTSLLGKGMPDTRVYVTAERPLTLFKYNGFNPEVPDGIDRQFYPVPSVYTIGLNLKF
ncbi:MAG: SusC/RagA family TonB-linked outer membrane protein [Mangrovibacterium sp.]